MAIKRLVGGFVLLAVFMWSGSSWAQTSNILAPRFDPKRPIHITAQRMEADNASRIVRFLGNVIAVQNDVILNCDVLIIRYSANENAPAQPESPPLAGLPEAGQEVEKLVAVGRVQMIQGDRSATCDQAEYDQKKGTITLTGNPQVVQGQDAVRGGKILINVSNQQVNVLGQGNQQVSVTINPRTAREAAKQQEPTPNQGQDQDQDKDKDKGGGKP